MAAARLLDWLGPAALPAEIDWNSVYREELPRVYNFFRYRFGHTATAEDLTSLTFEKAWRARLRYRQGRAAVSTWLLAIARNVAVDHLRRARREVPIDDLQLASPDTPETTVLRRDRLSKLATLLAALPERQRELLALKYGAGTTNRAIAKLTGLSESNVGTILNRTVEALRASWEDGGTP